MGSNNYATWAANRHLVLKHHQHWLWIEGANEHPPLKQMKAPTSFATAVGRNSLYRPCYQFLGHFPYFRLILTHPHYPTIFPTIFPNFPLQNSLRFHFHCQYALSQKLLKLLPQSIYMYTRFQPQFVHMSKLATSSITKTGFLKNCLCKHIQYAYQKKATDEENPLWHWNRGFQQVWEFIASWRHFSLFLILFCLFFHHFSTDSIHSFCPLSGPCSIFTSWWFPWLLLGSSQFIHIYNFLCQEWYSASELSWWSANDWSRVWHSSTEYSIKDAGSIVGGLGSARCGLNLQGCSTDYSHVLVWSSELSTWHWKSSGGLDSDKA